MATQLVSSARGQGVGEPGEIHRYCPWDGHRFQDRDLCCSLCGCGRSFGTYEGQKRLEYLDSHGSEDTQWRKILWEKSAYEDNYTDHTFLLGLRRNTRVKPYNYSALVRDSGAIIQQVATLALFTMLFYYTWTDFISLNVLLGIEILFLLAGYGLRIYIDPSFTTHSILLSVRSVFLLVGSLACLSPVLATLTNSFTNDTIFVLTMILMPLHLVSHDYAFDKGTSKRFGAPVSLNAIIFASVLLASRLSTNVHVFALVFLAIELFALFPIMRQHLWRFSPRTYFQLTSVMVLLTAILIYPVSRFTSIAYVATVFFVRYVGAFWLMNIQKYKNEIQGPWDEAVPSSGEYYRDLR